MDDPPETQDTCSHLNEGIGWTVPGSVDPPPPQGAGTRGQGITPGNEILRLASAFFAQAELDRLKKK
jgi:hypothetical protein